MRLEAISELSTAYLHEPCLDATMQDGPRQYRAGRVQLYLYPHALDPRLQHSKSRLEANLEHFLSTPDVGPRGATCRV